MNIGKIVQVMGPVVDVVFEDQDLPAIEDALEVDNNGKISVMEVAQHIGNNVVRCIMLAPSEGLHRDMEVRATGSGIRVPVGEQTLGRLLTSSDRRLTVMRSRKVKNGSFTGIHLPLRNRVLPLRSWRQVSRSSTCWRLTQRAVRSVCSAVPVSVRPC